MKTTFGLLALGFTCVCGLALGATNEANRVDRDLAFLLPSQQDNQLLDYVKQKYKDEALLKHFLVDAGYSTSVEDFTDTYYDTADLKLLDSRGEIRHRRRYSKGQKAKDIIQIKLPSKEEYTLQEIKFEVRTEIADSQTTYGKENIFPLAALIKKKDVSAVVTLLTDKFEVPLEKLRPALTLRQTRNRVYITRPGGVLFTITLDQVHGEKWWAKTSFSQLEIEANELVYSYVDKKEQARMRDLQMEIAEDLTAKFASLKQAQTPKYWKIFTGLEPQIPYMRTLLRFGFI